MRGCLVLVSPLDPATGNRTTIRTGNARNSRTLKADGQTWHPAISRPPRISLDFFDIDYKGTVQFGKAALVLNAKRIAGLTKEYLTSLVWVGAPVTIYSGDAGSTGDMTVEFTGIVTAGVIDRTTGLVPLQCETNKKLIDVPLLNVEYGGGGGSDGDPEVRGTLKPAAFGRPFNVPVFFFDKTNWIGQVDGYGNIIAIDDLYEDAAAFGAENKAGDFASYAALVAADIAEGQWATCLSEGMVRLGADPQGIITCDPVCGFGTPGTMMQRWLSAHAGVSAGNIDAQSFTDLDSELTALLGHAPAVSFWTQTQVQVLDRMQAMSAACNATCFQGPNGKVAASRAISAQDPAFTFNRIGGRPIVTDWRSIDNPEPWWRLKAEAAKSWHVHALNEIDYEDDLVDRGDYDPAETYRQGHIVRSRSDGNRYLYVNADPASGHAPPDPLYWSLFELAQDATTIRYSDGVPVDDLQPAEAGADTTGTHTAAAIIGQGAFATASDADWKTQITGVGKPEDDATLGADWSDNLTGRPVPLLIEDDFSYDDSASFLKKWGISGADLAELDFSNSDPAVPGRRFLRVGNDAGNDQGWFYWKEQPLPFDPAVLYEVILVVRRVAGTGDLFAGVECLLDDKITIIDTNGNTGVDSHGLAHYFIASSARPALGEWQFYTGYFKGTGTLGTGGVHRSPANPGQVEEGTAFVRPMVLVNYPNDTGVYDIAYCRVRPAIDWSGNLVNRPDNLAALIGSEDVNNAGISIGSNGALLGGGGGQVTIGGLTPGGLDDLADGSTYARIRAIELTGGLHNIGVAGSGYKIGDQRNLKPIAAANLRYKFTGAVTYNATSTSATISVTAGSILLGSATLALNAMSATVSGTGGTTRTYQLYIVNPAFTGGSFTLHATTNGNDIYAADDRMWLGSVDVTFPVSGSGGGGGTVGGGGACVAAESFVETRDRGFVRAREIYGDWIRVLTEDREETEWAPVRSNALALEPAYRIVSQSGVTLKVSASTPLTLRDGCILPVTELDGHELPLLSYETGEIVWEPCFAEPIDPIPVSYISAGGRTYAAGDEPGRSIFTHNTVKP